MPVVLGEDSHHLFSKENEPLTEGMIEQFILGDDTGAADEFTEFVPCFSIEGTKGFIALVWWKAGLLRYEYFLTTFSPKGEMLDQRIISFLEAGEGRIRRSVANIDEDWEVYIAEGTSNAETEEFEPESTKTHSFEIGFNGKFVD